MEYYPDPEDEPCPEADDYFSASSRGSFQPTEQSMGMAQPPLGGCGACMSRDAPACLPPLNPYEAAAAAQAAPLGNYPGAFEEQPLPRIEFSAGGFGTGGGVTQQAVPPGQPLQMQPSSTPAAAPTTGFVEAPQQPPPGSLRSAPLPFADSAGAAAAAGWQLQPPPGGAPTPVSGLANPGPTVMPPPPAAEETPLCQCGVPSVQLTVRKEGPNTGRIFFKCPKPQGEQCRFFQWADEPPAPSSGNPHPQVQPGGGQQPPPNANTPPCNCGQPSAERTVRKEGPNTGRTFWCCAKPQGEQCGFFQFTDDPPKAATSGAAAPQMPSGFGGSSFGSAAAGFSVQQDALDQQTPLCSCGIPTARRTVRKEGANNGREFWTCPKPREEQCGFFQFVDEPPPAAAGAAGGRRPPVATPVRGQVQTVADAFRSHPAEADGFGRGSGFGGRGGGGRSGSDVCFHCNQPGHWASECPMKNGGYGAAGRGGKGGGRRAGGSSRAAGGGGGAGGGRTKKGKRGGGFEEEDVMEMWRSEPY
eukprot:CAMPEP_0178419438 /NCGR_PEP_ID=MMETSP0689_2-20121128/25610_1 /TAXON_ID=160604 /ORGANISM="Amphidinium massartii, Strain CS-259" /LENGTH=528 /DNA_ID=CAMNT_0020040875 /DNA_START=27 /DNA_END=1613 /DNA_ORIENTATION=+